MGYSEYWRTVERIVEARGGRLRKYRFFEEVWDALNEGTDLLILRAPTGSGKTEAVTAPFVHSLSIGRESSWLSIVYALPTRSLVFAMARRLSTALVACGVSRATVTVNYGALLTLMPFLEGDIAVTTYDTLFYAFYGAVAPGYHLLLPMSKVSGSLVILDEVQLLQDTHWYGLSLVPYHVSNLLRFGSQVVVMSATIPSLLRDEIEKKARIGGRKIREVTSTDLLARHKPKVEVVERPLPEDGEVIDIIRSEAVERGLFPVLIIVNTVQKAASIYTALLESGLELQPLLLHSRLRAGRRKEIENRFEEGGPKFERSVIVATQVVEAGLDLDVKLLITELSPVDSLIQRLGRCARRSEGRAIVFTDPGGGRYIYPQKLLERTSECVKGREEDLEEAVRVVEKAQSLVDEVYNPTLVEELRSNVRKELSIVKDLVANVFEPLLFSTKPREKIGTAQLLRLGVEIDSLYVSGDKYQKLLGNERVRMSVDELNENLVKLSLKDRALPACLAHSIGGQDRVIQLKLELLESGEVELRPTLTPRDRVELARHALFLLNPDCYETYRGHELGVVKVEWRYPSARL